MRKRVAILTRRYGNNFGSALQAYALQTIIGRINSDNVVLDYDELHHNIRWQIKPLLYDWLTRFMKIGLIAKLFPSQADFCNIRKLQIEKFASFDQRLNKTTKKLKTKQQLSNACKDCYACVCGSDQIWNPFLFDENYYLSFLNHTDTRKVSFAVSLGIYAPKYCTSKMIDLISSFDAISIREQIGCDIITNLTGKPTTHVIDPTLLLSQKEWEEMRSDYKIEGDYILCYFLKTEDIPNEFIRELKNKTNCRVVNIQMFYNINSVNADEHLYDVGPQDFLSLVAKARYVCTNSFHGTIFSYIFQRNFYVFNRFRKTEANNQNSRIDDLLQLLNMRERRMSSNRSDDFPIEDIDYLVSNELCKYQEISMNFLRKSLAIEA